MIDLHSHILPGVDDGARDAAEALAMVRLAAGSGTERIVATPHIQGGGPLLPWSEIVAGCDRLRQAARQQGEAIDILPGAEVALDPELLDRLKTPGPYCISGGRYILVELPATHVPDYAGELLFILQTRGFFPVIAHPERHPALMRRRELLRDWVRRGMLLQLTAASITGRFGKAARQAAETLLLDKLVHCIGTDAHGINVRRPDLSAAAARIIALVGPAAAGELLGEYPGRIVDDVACELPEPVREKQGMAAFWRGLLSSFRGNYG